MEIRLSPALYAAALPLAVKRAMLRRSADRIATLALGSSHGDFGFDPGYYPGAFNLCSTSQDFRHSHAILRRVAAGLPRLRNVVLFYSVFSPGHVLEKSPSDRHYALAMHELLDLEISYSHPDLARHSDALKGPLAQWEPVAEGREGFLPTLQKTFFKDSYGVERRAREHLKLNQNDGALMYLIATLIHAKRSGLRMLVVVPPARSDYRRACDTSSAQLFHGLEAIRAELDIGAEFELLNLFEDDEFEDEMFGDFDHLNPLGRGAELLSGKVARRLEGDPP